MSSITGTTSVADNAGYEDYRERMRLIQLDFIDDPRKAALDADRLAGELLQAGADELARRRKDLAAEPGNAAAPDTEHLRQSVRRYREFVDALAQTMDAFGESEQVASLELPEETTYRVGENGEAAAIDQQVRAEAPEEEDLDGEPRPESLGGSAAQRAESVNSAGVVGQTDQTEPTDESGRP